MQGVNEILKYCMYTVTDWKQIACTLVLTGGNFSSLTPDWRHGWVKWSRSTCVLDRIHHLVLMLLLGLSFSSFKLTSAGCVEQFLFRLTSWSFPELQANQWTRKQSGRGEMKSAKWSRTWRATSSVTSPSSPVMSSQWLTCLARVSWCSCMQWWRKVSMRAAPSSRHGWNGFGNRQTLSLMKHIGLSTMCGKCTKTCPNCESWLFTTHS